VKVVIYDPPGRTQARLLERGFKAHGINPLWRPRHRWEPADLAVTWAYKTPGVIGGQRRIRQDHLVMELAYFGDRRRTFVSLGFNGLNGHAEFHAKDMPGDRWAKHGVPVAPWKAGGDYVLVMGQVNGDASLATCPDYQKWLAQACEKAKAYGLPVYFRAHPMQKMADKVDVPHHKGTLEEALAGAAAVIAWNSNSLVDAVLVGVPVIAGDKGSMAWPVAAHEIGDELIRPDRTQWLHDLAYCQWTHEEIASGEAWAHLSRRYADRADWTEFTPEHFSSESPKQRRAREQKEMRHEKFRKRQELLARRAGENGVGNGQPTQAHQGLPGPEPG
jgi:hypothetical protein